MTGSAEVRRGLSRPRWPSVAGWVLGCWLAAGEAGAAVQLGGDGPLPASEQAGGPTFEVLSGEALGLDVRHRAGSPGAAKRFLIESLGPGLALVDVDADGDLDVYLVQAGDVDAAGRPQGAGDALRLNDGRGRFSPAPAVALASGFGFGVCAGDLDGDGDEDLLVTQLGANELLRNDGAGRLLSVPGAAGLAGGSDELSLGAAFGDPDGDGDLDVCVANGWRHDPSRPRASDAACSTPGCPWPCDPLGSEAQADHFFLNDGAGGFREQAVAVGLGGVEPAYSLQPAFVDLDGDGDQDLFVSQDAGANRAFVNQGRDPVSGLPRFVEHGRRAGLALSATGLGQAGLGVAVGDLDGDLAPDLFVTGASRAHHALFVNASQPETGALFFDEANRAGLGLPVLDDQGWGAALLDADHDGDLDVFVAAGHADPRLARGADGGQAWAQPDRLFVQAEPGRFREAPAPSGGRAAPSRGAAAGDLDGDGDLDLVVAVLDDLPLVWRNRRAPADDWLQLDLRPLTAAVGARVELELGPHHAVAVVRCGSSFLSSEDRRVHFGLPVTARGASPVVRVRWPDGLEERFDGLLRGRVHTLTRGAGRLGR